MSKHVCFLIILLYTVDAIRVITTNEDIKEWKNFGKMAEMECPFNLGDQLLMEIHFSNTHFPENQEITICGRFQIFNFLSYFHPVLIFDSELMVNSIY